MPWKCPLTTSLLKYNEALMLNQLKKIKTPWLCSQPPHTFQRKVSKISSLPNATRFLFHCSYVTCGNHAAAGPMSTHTHKSRVVMMLRTHRGLHPVQTGSKGHNAPSPNIRFSEHVECVQKRFPNMAAKVKSPDWISAVRAITFIIYVRHWVQSHLNENKYRPTSGQ